MDIKNLITAENNTAIQQILVISKQDIAIENAIKALNELNHINRIEFTSYEKNYGITNDLLEQVRELQDKLARAKYGRY
jgi:hypothetical protein